MNTTPQRCSRCGAVNPAPARFCNGCGTSLAEGTQHPADRLADRIDADARRRWNERWDPRRTWTQKQWNGNALACWIFVGLFILICIIALNIH